MSQPEEINQLKNPAQFGNVTSGNFLEIGVNGETKSYGLARIFYFGSTSVEKSTDFDITSTDNIGAVSMDTGSTDKTSKLPILADNQGREITFCKSGTGNYIIDGDGATINSSATQTITDNNSAMRVKAFPSEWRIV